MKNILVLGAGRSASTLISYLLEKSKVSPLHLTVADRDEAMVKRKTQGHPAATIAVGDALDPQFRRPLLQKADVIISMLPAHLHLDVVVDAIELKKHIITPSYASKEIRGLHEKAKEAGVLVLNEMGLDPGIDHLSAMKIIDEIRSEGHEMEAFESFCGGLVAPESDNNPWNYKFTWNPRNVVLAGSGGACKFIQEGKYKYIPYHKLFRRTEIMEIEGYGRFEGYANRDSLSYRKDYGLEDIPTIFRGTLRRPGFCKTWDLFVQLGATDDSYVLEGSEDMTYRDFINSFLSYSPTDSVELKLKYALDLPQDDERFDKLEWLGIFKETPVGIPNATPAQILQKILEDKWTLDATDKDMIVMYHKFVFKDKKQNKYREIHSNMVLEGDLGDHTAMSQTVGLPLGIAAVLLAEGKMPLTGVHLPTMPEVYMPVLKELENHGIHFHDNEVEPKLYRDQPF